MRSTVTLEEALQGLAHQGERLRRRVGLSPRSQHLGLIDPTS